MFGLCLDEGACFEQSCVGAAGVELLGAASQLERGLGIAAHLGVVTGLPTIGVAKKILTGQHEALGEQRGDQVELFDKAGHVIGTVLRSKDKVRPLIISPGWT